MSYVENKSNMLTTYNFSLKLILAKSHFDVFEAKWCIAILQNDIFPNLQSFLIDISAQVGGYSNFETTF